MYRDDHEAALWGARTLEEQGALLRQRSAAGEDVGESVRQLRGQIKAARTRVSVHARRLVELDVRLAGLAVARHRQGGRRRLWSLGSTVGRLRLLVAGTAALLVAVWSVGFIVGAFGGFDFGSAAIVAVNLLDSREVPEAATEKAWCETATGRRGPAVAIPVLKASWNVPIESDPDVSPSALLMRGSFARTRNGRFQTASAL